MTNYQQVLDFWFEELTPEDWFKKDENLDLKITERFIALHSSVVSGECSSWRADSLGRLAEIIVIDQFSRNIYRDEPKAFIYDPMALALSQEAIRGSHHVKMDPRHKQFLYMPFMHSESKFIHNSAMLLFSESGLENAFDFELKHKDIIERFGRYPHRNKILGRDSTPDEEAFVEKTGNIFESDASVIHQSISIKETISIH